jgi:K+-sensing histidine kinase KdpD
MRNGRLRSFGLKAGGYVFAVCGVAVVTGALAPFNERLSSTTVALVLLLAVLFAATGRGSRPAILAALLGVVCFAAVLRGKLQQSHGAFL